MSTPLPTPQQMAAALTYGANQNAPTVIAKGRGIIAQAIIERAKQHGIFVHESTDLVALLMQIELDQEIPAQLYLAVAELLGWLYQMEHKATGTVLSSTPA
jgi:flagellar biosynthesis protein